nr:MAG TPA: hypothetical protein [Caudoviricetes sp.]
MILAYVEGAILPRHVCLQGPEADIRLGAFFCASGSKVALFDKLAWLTGSKRRNAM